MPGCARPLHPLGHPFLFCLSSAPKEGGGGGGGGGGSGGGGGGRPKGSSSAAMPQAFAEFQNFAELVDQEVLPPSQTGQTGAGTRGSLPATIRLQGRERGGQ